MRVRRAAVQDAYFDGGRSAVFVDGQVIVLSEIAAAILAVTERDRYVGVDVLSKMLVRDFGQPPAPLQASVLAYEHVLDLVAHKVLESEHDVPDGKVTSSSVSALAGLLRHLRSESSLQWTLPDGVPAADLVSTAARHRVLPFIAARHNRMVLPAEAAADLRSAARQEQASTRRLIDDLGVVLDTLDSAGIRCIVFKGVALAALAHGDPAARGTGDIDLLVEPHHLERAHSVLNAAGWDPTGTYPAPGTAWSWRQLMSTGHELSLQGVSSDIDLHWHLGRVRKSLPDFDQVWRRRTTVFIQGRSVATLSQYDALRHSAEHAANDEWRWMRGLLDVHLLMASPTTWAHANAPLTRNQLLSVGLASRSMGIPKNSPDVVRAASALSDWAVPTMTRLQRLPTGGDSVTALPGLNTAKLLASLRRANAGPLDYLRALSYSIAPPWITASETSPHLWVAGPRVILRRIEGSVRRAARAARRRRRT